MICPHCTAEIRDDSNFCIYCGTAVGPQTLQYANPHRRLNFAKVLGDTFKLCIRHFAILCLVGLIVVGIPAIIQIGYVSIPGTNETPFAIDDLTMLIVGLTLWLLGFLAQCYVPIVAIRQCLHIARGGTGFQKGMMFPPLIVFLNMIGLMFILSGILWALTLPLEVLVLMGGFFGGFASASGGIAFPMFGLTLVVMGLFVAWLGTRFWLAQFFLVDQQENLLDALSQAWEASAGNCWALLGAFVLFACPALFWTIACFALAVPMGEDVAMIETVHGILLLSAGLVPTLLFMWFGSGLAYLQLTEQPH